MAGRIKLLFVAEELCTNGAMMSLLALLEALPSDKYDISLFMFRHSGDMMSRIPRHVHLLPESIPYAVHRMPLKPSAALALKKCRPDLLVYRSLVSVQRRFGLRYNLWSFLPHIPGYYDIACCYTDGFVAPVIMKKVNATKKVCWIHMPYSYYRQSSYIYDALKQADICVPVSSDVGKDLNHILGIETNQHIVHNITDAEKCKEKATQQCEKERRQGIARIVSVGRVTPQKNFEIIPSVANILKNKGLHFEWYIIGDGESLQQLRTEVRESGLSDNVYFIGARNNPMPWIKSTDVFVNPSRFEAWGMTVSEALCLGKAVITSDIPVFSEQIETGVNGIMCPSTADAIANAIFRILSDADLKSRLELNAANYRFTKESVIAEFEEMVDILMNRQ